MPFSFYFVCETDCESNTWIKPNDKFFHRRMAREVAKDSVMASFFRYYCCTQIFFTDLCANMAESEYRSNFIHFYVSLTAIRSICSSNSSTSTEICAKTKYAYDHLVSSKNAITIKMIVDEPASFPVSFFPVVDGEGNSEASCCLPIVFAFTKFGDVLSAKFSLRFEAKSVGNCMESAFQGKKMMEKRRNKCIDIESNLK